MKKYNFIIILFILSIFIIPFSVKAITYNFGTVTLRNGSKGEAVMDLQRFLNANLNLGLVIDGKLGPKTITVIKTWQTNHGLVADGLIGLKTKAIMNNSIVESASIPTPHTSAPMYDCNQKKFTMALIFVAKDINDSSFQKQRYLEELTYIKNRLPWAFNFATEGLVTMTIPNDPVFIDGKGVVSSDNFDLSMVLKKFYETNNDDYDFVSIFTNAGNTTGNNYHLNVINNIKGIGLSSDFNNSSNNYGSSGKLMGINYLDDLLDVDSTKGCYLQEKNNLDLLTTGNNCGMLTLLHETAHQWGVYVGDILDTDDPTGLGLPIKNSGAHYSMLLTSPTGTKDTLGGIVWKKSFDNSVAYIYDEDNTSNLIKYHPFTLYFMGLLPKDEYDTKFDILQHETSYQITPSMGAMAMKSIYKQVSVRDIVSKEGERKCIK